MKRRVIMYPYGPLNPYQPLLAQAMGKLGCCLSVEPRREETLPFYLLSMCRDAKVLHLHWIGSFYEGRTWPRFVIRTFLFSLCLLVLRIRGVRLVWTLHNLVPHDTRFRSLHLAARKLIAFLVHSIIVHSDAAMREAIRHFGCRAKYRVLPVGSYSGVYPSNISREGARARLGIPIDRKVALFFGAIRPYKGVKELIAAAKDMDILGISLLIAGNGEESYLRQLSGSLPKNVIFHGRFIPDDQVQYYMRAADCQVLPYLRSTSTSASMVGLAFNLPLVTTDDIAFSHLIEKRLAVTCNPTNAKSITTAIKEVLSWDIQEFTSRCYEFLQECSWDRIAHEHMMVYGLANSISSDNMHSSTPEMSDAVND